MGGVVARLRHMIRGVGRRVSHTDASAAGGGRHRPVVVAAEFADAPIASFYAFASAATIVDVPLRRCRGLWFAAFSCGPDGDHPFIQTMATFARGEVHGYEGSPLQAYYERWRPASAAEALGLADDGGGGHLRQLPALAAVAPWWSVEGLEAFAADFAVRIEAENGQHESRLPASAGCVLHGPVSVAKGELEYARCLKVYASVRASGYQRSSETLDGDVRGQVLAREDGAAYAVLVLSGQHRVAAAAAAGMSSIPIRFVAGSETGRRLVRRSDVAAWPAVRHGWLTVPQALHVFDRILAARPPWASAGPRP